MRKKNRIIIIILSLFLAHGGMGSLGDLTYSAYGSDNGQDQHYIVVFDHSKKAGLHTLGLDSGEVAKRRLQDQILETFDLIDGAKVLLTSEEAARLEGTAGIAFIEPDYPVYLLDQTLPWGVRKIYGGEAYPFDIWQTTKGQGIKIAIIDSGIQMGHEDLHLAGGDGIVEGKPWYTDENGHGTHVAGIVGAQVNDVGVVGVAPEVSLYSLKVFGVGKEGNLSAVLSAIQWAVDNDIKIINMSLGTKENSAALKNICDSAYEAGHLLIAAAGNSGTAGSLDEIVEYPAKYDSVIAVGATTSANKRAYFSATGQEVELMAPGNSILSTYRGEDPVGRVKFQLGEEDAYEPDGKALEKSGLLTVGGPLVYCGLAADAEPIETALSNEGLEGGEGWIALIDRGISTFADKVRLVMELGALGAVIINNELEEPDSCGNFSLDDGGGVPPEGWIPAVSISYNSGQELRDKAVIRAGVEVGYNAYETMNGTSMAAPHVSGAAAIIWAKNPSLTNDQVRTILGATAMDLGLSAVQQGKGLIRLNTALEMADDIRENRGLSILDFNVDEDEGKVALDLRLKARPGTEVQVISGLYKIDGRLISFINTSLEVEEYGQDLGLQLPWDRLSSPATVKAFILDGQFKPLGKSEEIALP